MIIKGFATMSLCIIVDDMFAKNFPASVIENGDDLNDSIDAMKMPLDQNTFSKVCHRFYKRVFDSKKIENVVPISNDESFQRLPPKDRKARL